MDSELSRRNLLQAVGAAAVMTPASAMAAEIPGPRMEGANTPKICLEMGAGALAAGNFDDAGIRRLTQLGVAYALTGGPRMPWKESELRDRIEKLKAGGITMYNMMIGGFPKTIYGKPGRDEEIDQVKASIRAAGKAGLPVVEYNFYAHRAMEGYHELPGRAGSGYTGFDYSKMKDLPPLEQEGAHSLDEMWANITYFLKAVIPVAEEAGVRMALHPNDPPAPLSRGSGQIMGTVAGWKKLIGIVNSPSNGITFDCGVTREMGENPVEVCRYFASRDRINHVHFRNVQVEKPYEKYAEVWLDNGQVDMFGVMKELVKNKYTRTIYPEHPRAIDYDREHPGFRTAYPGGGGYAAFSYNVGFAKAMLQAALASV